MREEVTKQDILRAINELIARQRKFIEKIDATNAESKTDIAKVEKVDLINRKFSFFSENHLSQQVEIR